MVLSHMNYIKKNSQINTKKIIFKKKVGTFLDLRILQQFCIYLRKNIQYLIHYFCWKTQYFNIWAAKCNKNQCFRNQCIGTDKRTSNRHRFLLHPLQLKAASCSRVPTFSRRLRPQSRAALLPHLETGEVMNSVAALPLEGSDV